MALYTRHPKFTITLLVLIFISVLMFASDSPLHSAAFNSYRGPLAETLGLEEMYYGEMLQRRQELIKKWGPTSEKIDP